MCIAYQNDQIISIAHDKRLFITTLKTLPSKVNGQNEISITYE